VYRYITNNLGGKKIIYNNDDDNVFSGGRDYNTAEQGRRKLVRGQY